MYSTAAFQASAFVVLVALATQERSTAHCTRASKKTETDDAGYRHFRVAREERCQANHSSDVVFFTATLSAFFRENQRGNFGVVVDGRTRAIREATEVSAAFEDRVASSFHLRHTTVIKSEVEVRGRKVFRGSGLLLRR